MRSGRIALQDERTGAVQGESGSNSIMIAQSRAPSLEGSYLRWVAPSALSIWLIPHGMGRRPAVSTLDDDGNQIFGEVQHLDANTVSITFSSPVLGSAELN